MWLSDGTLEHLRVIADAPDTSGTRYRILAPIGAGGMGAVYHAHDVELQRDVALKVLRAPEIRGNVAARMLEEARTVAGLEHPGIVPIHDAGTLADGRTYYAMRLVRGQRLDEAVEETMPLAERLRIFRRICEPVAYAHARGVVHGDLKPANIMVGDFGAVFVMDWGAAIGTPGWMAPEQSTGGGADVGTRTDVHGLGAVLRFLLGNTQRTGDARGRNRTPRPLRAICERAVAADPTMRYPDASALAADIDRFLDGEPVSAYREPVWDRAARLFRRHHVAVLLILTYLLMRIAFILFR